MVYMEELLLKVKESRIGCHIGNTFCGALGCADDVSLLCPSHSSLIIMLIVADEFANNLV